jgi:hypothetical protein
MNVYGSKLGVLIKLGLATNADCNFRSSNRNFQYRYATQYLSTEILHIDEQYLKNCNLSSAMFPEQQNIPEKCRLGINFCRNIPNDKLRLKVGPGLSQNTYAYKRTITIIIIINVEKLTSLNLVLRTTNMTPVKPQITKFHADTPG